MLLHELQPDPAACLVDLLHEHVEHVAALDHVLDVVDAAGADVRDVQQPVGALLELDEGAEVGRLDDLAGELVADLGILGERGDRGDRRVAVLAGGGVDEDRPVLLDVDLHLVLGLERADRLAALADHHADVLGVDLHRRDARRVAGELQRAARSIAASMRSRIASRACRACASACSMISRETPVILMSICSAVIPVARAGDLEVHVAEVVLGALDVGEDDVVVALLDEAHRDARRPARVIGTPASISASVEPQTEPIDEEPFDSSVSETTRIV